MADGSRSISHDEPANNASLAAATLNANWGSSRPRNRRPLPNSTEYIDDDRQNWARASADCAMTDSLRSHSNRNTNSPTVCRGMVRDDSFGLDHPFSRRDPSPISGAGMNGPKSLETSLRQGWASFRGLASTFIGLGDEVYQGTSYLGSNQRQAVGTEQHMPSGRREGDGGVGLGPATMAIGSGIDTGRSVDRPVNFKRRTSDASLEDAAKDEGTAQMDQMVYIHHVQKGDTYAGLTLRYRCHKDDIRKANGLWTRDNIQIRRWLAIPCDSCEIRGAPCEANPTPLQPHDVLDKGPHDADITNYKDISVRGTDANTHSLSAAIAAAENVDDFPWKHVRWVRVETFPHPVEVARMSRRTLGYFPPRRKRGGSGDGISPPSPNLTPRQSIETMGSPPGSAQSRSPLPVVAEYNDPSSPTPRPAWMRRPGGVGTLSGNVTAPGPERDYLNSWTKKHLPGLNLDSYPSMSIAETRARDDFDLSLRDADLSRPSREHSATTDGSYQTSGLDRAAAAVETWMRGAFTTLRAGTPKRGFAMESLGEGDLIELEDNNSDDGNLRGSTVPRMSTSTQARSSSGTVTQPTKAPALRRIVRPPNMKED